MDLVVLYRKMDAQMDALMDALMDACCAIL